MSVWIKIFYLFVFAALEMSEYLIKPKRRTGASVVKGDKFRPGEGPALHVLEPAPSNSDVPAKSAEMLRVETADGKVLEARRRKQEAAARLAAKKKNEPVRTGKPSVASKRSGTGTSSRPAKRSKPVDPASVVDLDPPTNVPAPSPIRSVPPREVRRAHAARGGSSGGAGESSVSVIFLYYYLCSL